MYCGETVDFLERALINYICFNFLSQPNGYPTPTLPRWALGTHHGFDVPGSLKFLLAPFL